LANEPDEFVSDLVHRLQLAVPQGEPSRGDEATRLLNAREYNAAIIAAMSHLEATLRQRLDKQPWNEVRRPMSLRSLVDRAVEQGALQQDGYAYVVDWIPLRNSVVHAGMHATREQATAVVEGVRRILGEPNLE
jgi:hypothetical protein